MTDNEKEVIEELMHIVKVLPKDARKSLIKVGKEIIFVERLRNECK